MGEQREVDRAEIKRLERALKRAQKAKAKLRDYILDLVANCEKEKAANRDLEDQLQSAWRRLHAEVGAHKHTHQILELTKETARGAGKFMASTVAGLSEADYVLLSVRLADAEDAARRARDLLSKMAKGWAQKVTETFGEQAAPADPMKRELLEFLEPNRDDFEDED
jgi:chromosome segregation ATPase